MKTNSSEKRGGYRFLAGLQASLSLGSDEFDCRAVDIHRKGVMLEGTFEARPDRWAAVSLRSPSEDLHFIGRGRVTHVSKNEDNGNTRVGIQFEELAAEQQENLGLLVSRVVEGMNPAALAHLSRDASLAEIREALHGIPLAHKIMMAQRALPADRGFLLHDESNRVVEALCRNPQLTMPEVVKILRVPTLLPTTLELLSRDSRWNDNEEIKITIATHPRVTLPVAERMVKTLSLAGIRKIIRRPGLNPALKDKIVQSVPHKQLQGW